ncbi:hypothetical protein NDU88_006403 [Pleurodeles waltl]|uniref:Myb/SANT-like DNA-binding domain-containing protein n=1 Tax=Pleurodeles waltl TaxID=8319 RepID=A0AAV7NQ59_PLEWA|nr:hypothetical protein NDU88_006403 [Pleurodeles waltl]
MSAVTQLGAMACAPLEMAAAWPVRREKWKIGHSAGVVRRRGEDLHCKCCCDLCLEAIMAHVSGERAPAFTAEELEKLVDGVLPQYTLLYGPPDKHVSAYQKKGIWRAIVKEVRTLGVFDWQSTQCCKRWEDLRRWAKKTAETQLGLASQQGRGARRTITPPDVLHPDGGLSGVGWALEGITAATRGIIRRKSRGTDDGEAASHMGLEAESTEGEATSGTECERSTTTGTGVETTDSDTSSNGSSLAVADTSVATPNYRVSRTQASTSASKSASAVVPATHRSSKGASISPASVPPTPAKDKSIPPPAKMKKGPACRKGKVHKPPSKVSSTPAARAKVTPPSAKVRKGQKTPGKALQPSEASGEDLVASRTTASPATCTAASTASSPAASTATCPAASTTTVSSNSPSGQPSEAAGEGLEPPSTTGSNSTCTTASTAICTADSTAAGSSASTANSPAHSRTTTSSSPCGQLSKAAGEGLEPPTTTGRTPTSTGTTTSLQPLLPQDKV